jgi:hypothetical protein
MVPYCDRTVRASPRPTQHEPGSQSNGAFQDLCGDSAWAPTSNTGTVRSGRCTRTRGSNTNTGRRNHRASTQPALGLRSYPDRDPRTGHVGNTLQLRSMDIYREEAHALPIPDCGFARQQSRLIDARPVAGTASCVFIRSCMEWNSRWFVATRTCRTSSGREAPFVNCRSARCQLQGYHPAQCARPTEQLGCAQPSLVGCAEGPHVNIATSSFPKVFRLLLPSLRDIFSNLRHTPYSYPSRGLCLSAPSLR